MDTSKIRTFHGKGSVTFTPPPTDRFLTVPQLHEFNANHSPKHPFFVYVDDDGKEIVIDRAQGWTGMERASQLVWDRFKSSGSNSQSPIIGILATADTISYMCLVIGIMRLGFIPFPISTRNSAAAVAHLLKATGTKHVIVSPDDPMQRLCQETAEMLAKEDLAFEVLPMVTFEELFPPEGKHTALDAPVNEFGPEDIAMILHSSGSTSFPKPIRIRAKTFLQWSYYLSFGEVDFCGLRLSLQTTPVFHALGIMPIAFMAATGVVAACYKPSVPPVVPTPENFLASLLATRCDIGYCVPAFVEAWVRDDQNIPVLQNLTALIYGGAPLHPETGEKLAKAGVHLVPFYGATELGGIGVLIPKEKPTMKTYGYFKFSPHIDVVLRPQDGADDLFEPVLVESNPNMHSLNAVTTTVNGYPAYETKDLVQRHPEVPNLWRVYGRTDDQIVLSTGEKTNPGPIEAILTMDPHISAALMFGRGKFQNGVIIQPAPAHVFDPSDNVRLEAFRNAIWPTVEKANAIAPSHSRLFKEMIIVTDPSKPFEYTAKGSPRRQVSLNAYSKEIESLYANVAETTQTDLQPPADWTADATLDFVRTVVKRVLARPLGDDDDLFQAGCDSLQATWIRNTLGYAMRTTVNIPLHALPFDFVYANPTVNALTRFVLKVAATKEGHVDSEAALQEKVRIMEALVAKYIAGLPPRGKEIVGGTVNGNNGEDEYVLLTGSTGRLGCWLLALLLEKPTVKRVYALNRGTGEELRKRQREAFETWGLDGKLLDSERLVLLAGDTAKPHLGLDTKVYDEIRTSVTGIIMNGWRVDFNVSLQSNEPLLAGVRHLIDLALSSPRPTPPHILFTSSISVVRNLPSGIPVPEHPLPDARVAVGNGYSESKWAAERMLELAPVPSTVVRVGQLAGDTKHGAWGVREWVPALMRGSQALGCLPKRDERVTWLPIDVAARALLEMRQAKNEHVLHLVHPRPTHWDTLIARAAAQLGGLPLVPYAEWVARLRAAVESESSAGKSEAARGRRDPASVLLGFFERGEFGEDVVLGTERAVEVSEVLRGVEKLGEREMNMFFAYWRELGFLD